MAALTTDERLALLSLRNGGHLRQAIFDQLLHKKLVSKSPLEMTHAGRIVCELLQEIDGLRREENAASRGEF